MKRSVLFLITLLFQIATVPGLASTLCQTEYSDVLGQLQNYAGDDEERRELISLYHNKKSMLSAICPYEKVNKIEKQFAKVVGQNSSYSYFQPRQTVEIATIQLRSPASR